MTQQYLREVEYTIKGTLWHDLNKLLLKLSQPAAIRPEDEPKAVEIAKKLLSLLIIRYEAKELLARMGTGWKDDIDKAICIHGLEVKQKKHKKWLQFF